MFHNKFYVDGAYTGSQPDFKEAFLIKALLDNLQEDYTGNQLTEIEAALWKMVDYTIEETDKFTDELLRLLVGGAI